jgi:hypothetical protein
MQIVIDGLTTQEDPEHAGHVTINETQQWKHCNQLSGPLYYTTSSINISREYVLSVAFL